MYKLDLIMVSPDQSTTVAKNTEKYYGTIESKFVPRIGEKLQITNSMMLITDVVYEISWERVEKVKLYIKNDLQE